MRETTHSRTEALLVGGLLALSWLSIFVAHDLFGEEIATAVPQWAGHLLVAAMLIPLLWRRRWPLGVLGVVTALALSAIALRIPDGLGPSVALFVALYAAGAYGTHRARDLVRGVAFAATLLVAGWQVLGQQEYVGYDAALFSVHILAVNVAFFVAGWLLGDAARRRRADQLELQRRADRLATEQRAREQRAILDERVRIARELHDVVAHHVSVMGVQASAARRVIDVDAAAASEALSAIERSARAAVNELQRLLGFLRDAQDVPDREEEGVALPQPTLESIDALVSSAGLPARVRRVGRPRPLPASVELSAFRVIQEALTNVLKHAGLVPTTIVLSYAVDSLDVEVVNERGGSPTSPPGSGRGLVGMRERVVLLGGSFEHGATRTGGYRVAVSLPTTADSVADRVMST